MADPRRLREILGFGYGAPSPAMSALEPFHAGVDPAYMPQDVVTASIEGGPSPYVHRGIEAIAGLFAPSDRAAAETADKLNAVADFNPFQGAYDIGKGIGDAWQGGDKLETILGMFGGPAAKTANRQMLSKAEDMLKAGADKLAVWNETGWFKGKDGKWRFEIDDSTSTTKGYGPMTDIVAKRGETAQDVFRHPELFAAYPEIGETRIQPFVDAASSKGYFQGPDILDEASRGEVGLNNGLRGEAMGSTMLHELQHGVQAKEGFSSGASMFGVAGTEAAQFARYADAAQQVQNRITLLGEKPGSAAAFVAGNEELDPQMLLYWAEKPVDELKRVQTENSVRRLYERSAGEVEARNVQARRNMTPEQRRATAPWLTEDVPSDQQILGRRDGGRQKSVDLPAAVKAAQKGIRGYHGSKVPGLTEFDLSKAGTATDAGQLGQGVYLSTDRKVAEGYPHQYEADVGLSNPLQLSMPDWKTDKAELVKAELGLPKDADAAAISEALRARGHDGVVLDYSPTGYAHQEMMVLDPKSAAIVPGGRKK